MDPSNFKEIASRHENIAKKDIIRFLEDSRGGDSDDGNSVIEKNTITSRFNDKDLQFENKDDAM